MARTLTEGMIITIFQDPLTETTGEGEAKLIRQIQRIGNAKHFENEREVQIWEVNFLNDGKRTFQRRILV